MRPRRNPDIAWRLEKGMHAVAWEKLRKGEEYENLGVLTLLVDGAIHQLNLVGAEIWTRINSVNTIEKIAAEVAPLFGADFGEMQADVLEFLKGIEAKGWVTLPANPSHAAPKWKAK